jgi:hypothetical protein
MPIPKSGTKIRKPQVALRPIPMMIPRRVSITNSYGGTVDVNKAREAA